MNLEKRIKDLRRELHALKAAFMASGTQINLFTKTLAYNTKENLVTEGGFTYDDQERVVVTFDTTEGVNTLAKLEISGNYDMVPVVRRVPYNGGAKWVVSSTPRYSGGWQATSYNFVVQSLVNGTVSAKMIWE